MEIEIIYEDEDIVAINKPHGLLVHKTNIARDAKVFALQLLRDKINQRVYPAHRLDRKTSGVLLFSKSKESDLITQTLFRERKIEKEYVAIVRGFVPDSDTIDYALTENDKTQDAVTHYKLKKYYELNFPSGKFSTSRYSHIEVFPETGRFHQIRKHMSHIFHPIIGDRPHGCNKQNRIWKEKFEMTTMLLHASKLTFKKRNGELLTIDAPISNEFSSVLGYMEKNSIYNK